MVPLFCVALDEEEVDPDVALAKGEYDESNVCKDYSREATVVPVMVVAPVMVAADNNDNNRDSIGMDVAASPEDRVATVATSGAHFCVGNEVCDRGYGSVWKSVGCGFILRTHIIELFR